MGRPTEGGREGFRDGRPDYRQAPPSRLPFGGAYKRDAYQGLPSSFDGPRTGPGAFREYRGMPRDYAAPPRDPYPLPMRQGGPPSRFDNYRQDMYRGAPSGPAGSPPSIMSLLAGQKRRRSPPPSERYAASQPRPYLMPRERPEPGAFGHRPGVQPPKASLLPPKRIEADQKDDKFGSEGLEDDDKSSDSDESSYDQDEVEIEIERVDNDIAKQERILANARAKMAAAERIAKEKAMGIESVEKIKQTLLPESIMEEFRSRNLEHITDPPPSLEQLIADIYAANRKLAKVFQEKSQERELILYNFGNLNLGTGEESASVIKRLDSLPPVDSVKNVLNAEVNPFVRPWLVAHIRANMQAVDEEMNMLMDEYADYEQEWNERVAKMEEKGDAKPEATTPAKSSSVSRGIASITSSTLAPAMTALAPVAATEDSAQSIVSTTGRSSRRSGFRSDAVRSEAEWEKALSFLGILPEDNNGAGAAVKPFSGPISKDKLAKEVPMITDPDLARKMKFQDNNSLVLDPEKELQDYNNLLDLKWSDFDRASFKTKLTTYGKDFYKIGNEMDMKSTQDCVIYYYREKMNQRFKNLIRKSQSGRGRRKKEKGEDTRLPPFKVFTLAEDEEFVPPVPYFPPADTEASVEDEGRQTPDILGPDDKRRAIIDAVSAPASPLGSPTELDRLNATWTEEESQKALRGFELFGRDFNAVAVMVTTKTPFQCKVFFNNHRRNAKEESHASSTSAVPASEGDQKKGKDSSAKKKSKTSRKRAESTPQVSVPLKLEAERVEEDEDPAGGEKKRKAADAVDTRKKPRKGTGEAGAVGVEGTDLAPRKTISYWSISEKAEFLKVLALHGKNFEAIARSLQTKSVIQVRNYFGNYKDKRELDDALDKYTNSVGQHIDPVPKVSLEYEAPTDRSFSFPAPDQPYSPHLPPVQVPSRLSVSPTKIPSLKSLVALSNSPQYLPPMLDQRPPDSVQEMFPSGASSIPERVTLAPIQLAAVETGERPEGPEASSAAFPLPANESKLPPIKLTFKLAATEHSVADAGDSTEETMPLTVGPSSPTREATSIQESGSEQIDPQDDVRHE